MQLVAIASMMVMRPRVLVMDEPTSQLDPQGEAEVVAALREMGHQSWIGWQLAVWGAGSAIGGLVYGAAHPAVPHARQFRWLVAALAVASTLPLLGAPFVAIAGMSLALFEAMHTAHVWCACVIIVGTLLHIGGVYKHAAFNQDGTFAKMLVAARPNRSGP